MITFRNYVVTLVAVFLALAAGVALGGGPLSDLGRPGPSPASAPTTTRDAYGDDFARAVAARVYDDGLKSRDVTLVTLPGADPGTVSALTRQVQRAGGRITTTAPIGADLVDAGQKTLVDTLGSQLMTQLKGAVSTDATTYPRMGELLGLALATRGGADAAPGDDASAVRQSLAAAHLLTVPDGAKLTPLVLVVAGDEVDPAILGGIAHGLAARARGVVVTGPTAASDLVALTTDDITRTVTVVDGAERPLGQVSTVAALVGAYDEQGGSYGASGADGALPLR